eukprot:1181575-Prorocentrum_minimum.AAC.1
MYIFPLAEEAIEVRQRPRGHWCLRPARSNAIIRSCVGRRIPAFSDHQPLTMREFLARALRV